MPDPDPPVRLTLPANVVGFPGVNPNTAGVGRFLSFRSTGLVATSNASSVLMTAKVDRDASTLQVTGLSDLVMVGDLYSLGLPDPTFPSSKGFTGAIDYSPDGGSIVASIYYDLWLVHLSADNTIAGTDLLTANTDGFAEWKPSIAGRNASPSTAGAIVASTGACVIRIIADPDTGAVTRVTGNKNKGDAGSSRTTRSGRPTGHGLAGDSSTRLRVTHHARPEYEIFLIRPTVQTLPPRSRIRTARVGSLAAMG